eukprot:3668077-Alexandrium_andersonii.AAC.1
MLGAGRPCSADDVCAAVRDVAEFAGVFLAYMGSKPSPGKSRVVSNDAKVRDIITKQSPCTLGGEAAAGAD